MDKDTEYLANFNTKSQHNPVDLLCAYVNTTGKRPRYLRVDGAKRIRKWCHSRCDMVEFCVQNHIILQTVVAYNHTMQARVEGAIGYVKQHSRVAMLAANIPTRIWPQATTDFVHTSGKNMRKIHTIGMKSNLFDMKLYHTLFFLFHTTFFLVSYHKQICSRGYEMKKMVCHHTTHVNGIISYRLYTISYQSAGIHT